MIRIKKLINKNDIFDWVNNPDIGKVILINKDNRELRNPKLCKIHIHLNIKFNDFVTIIGMCRYYLDNHNIFNQKEIDLLSGIISSKANGFIKLSTFNRLIDIEKNHSINLAISKNIKTLVEKYT